jgi:hypothetical protein
VTQAEAVAAGKQPFFLKASDKRKLELVGRYQAWKPLVMLAMAVRAVGWRRGSHTGSISSCFLGGMLA